MKELTQTYKPTRGQNFSIILYWILNCMSDTNKNVSISVIIHLQKPNLLSQKKPKKTEPICGAKNPTNISIDYCKNSINSIIFVKLFFSNVHLPSVSQNHHPYYNAS